MATLKPFVLNLNDLNFLYNQITFQALFDQFGNAIINWDGIGSVYDGHGNLLGTGGLVAGDVASLAAIAQFGASYPSTTSLQGIRDVSGLNNNLLQTNATYGAADQPFVRTMNANFADYVKPLSAADPNAYYGAKTFDLSAAPGIQYSPSSNYTTTVSNTGVVTQSNVVDYTARMISRTATTADTTALLDANNHLVNWDSALYASDPVYQALIDSTAINTATLVEGAAVVTNYWLLETLGHKDYQKDAGSPGSNEYFIGAENPGVAPTNGWFAIFGQFFDHGLDLIGKGGQGTTIKIALATDDPLYGAIGSDGRPTTSITIGRATVSGKDANGNPTYLNHTSPFIDQSQTYGSHAQMTNLLREWVSTDNGVTFHAGMELFDGQTLATAWKRPDGVMTTQTLPTLNELRDHVLDTNRDGLTWEDVLDFRNRDANGDVLVGLGAGDSGQALILDMNPRFDGNRLDAATAVGTSNVNALIDAAVATLAGATPPGFAFGRTGADGVSGGIQLVVSGGAGAAFNVPDGAYTGASALMLWVNFANFSINAPAGAVHDAVGQILLAAVGDHYIAGDGRVNENVALTAIHHVFHEEHNFQIQNVINTINTQDAAASPATHDELHRWQINTGTTDANGNFINSADGSIAWDQDKMFNAAKLIVEMEYQHAAVDQYARTITPHIQEFVGYSSGVNPTVSLEFSQSAFRFGHSTIRETIDVIDPSHGLTGKIMSFALEQAFLNPALFAQTGPGGIALGMSHQQMNEVDEFITPALNQGLLGLPLDLAAMNIARGRDLGIPTLNEFRGQVGLTKYVSWDDFQRNMIHPQSLANFIAAYAFDGNVAKAQALVGLYNGSIAEGAPTAMGYSVLQAQAFMYNEIVSLGGNAAALLTAAATAATAANAAALAAAATDATALDATAITADTVAATANQAATAAAAADQAAADAALTASLTDAVALAAAAIAADAAAVAANQAATAAAAADQAAAAAAATANLTDAVALAAAATTADTAAFDAQQAADAAIGDLALAAAAIAAAAAALAAHQAATAATAADQAAIDTALTASLTDAALLATAAMTADATALAANQAAAAAAAADQAALDTAQTAGLTDAALLSTAAIAADAASLAANQAATAAAAADQAALVAAQTAGLTDAAALVIAATAANTAAFTAHQAATAAHAADATAAALAIAAADAAALAAVASPLAAASNAFNLIDTWLGGLAEAHVPGGLLGSTFDLVFTNQIESLMDGDRFYYLTRLFGQQFGEEVGNGQFKDIVERNTGLTHLNGSILAYADQYYDLSANDSNTAANSHKTEHKYGEILAANPTLGMWTDGSLAATSINNNGSLISVGGVTYVRDYRPDLAPNSIHPVAGTPTSGADSHEVLVGTDNRDYLHMRGGDDTAYGEGGNDTLFGDGGNDRLYGGDGNDWIDSGDGADLVDGGAGDDTIFGFGSGTEIGGFDQLVGGDGNDTIWGGEGVDKLSGGAGDDVLYGEGNTDPFTRGGDGNDYVDGGSGGDLVYGDDGDDLVVGGNDQDIVEGGNGDDILRPGPPSAAIGGGPDEVIGGDGFTDTGFDLMDLSDYALSTTGVTADMATQSNPLVAIDGTRPFPAWFQIDGVVGTRNNDTILGNSAVIGGVDGSNWLIGASGSDSLRGNGGNDVIVGGSIRLDSLIGTYANPYTSYDVYTGATHRTTGPLGVNGLLDAAGTATFGKHFTEFLKSDLFKDHVLGDGGADTASIDTAVFSGNRADYDISKIDFVDAHGAAMTAFKIVGARGAGVDDGTDLIVGIESVKFADMTLTQAGLLDLAPTDIQWNGINTSNIALPGINAIIANLSTVDADSVAPWTYSLQPGSSANFTVSAAGVVTRINSAMAPNQTYTLNVRSTDSVGPYRNETFTIRTGTALADNITANDFDNVMYGLGNNDILNGAGGNDTLFGQAGNDTLNGGTGNDRIDGGTGADTINGGSGNDSINYAFGDGADNVDGGADFDTLAISSAAGNQNLKVAFNGAVLTAFAGGTVTNVESVTADLGAGADTLTYTGSGVTVNLGLGSASGFTSIAGIENVTGNGGIDNLTGDGNANVLIGGANGDTLNGEAGNDVLTGGTGNDVVNGGAGDDTINYVIGDGADNVNGGADNDTLVISSAAGAQSLAVTFNGSVLTNFAGGSVTDVESVTVNLGAGTDTLTYTAPGGVTVNLGLGSASGFTSIAGIENVTGNGGIDNLTGDANANVLTGGGAADVLNGGAGNDTLNGGLGRDVMTGGLNNDIFDFNVVADSGNTVATADVIMDFVSGADDLDFFTIDANSGLGGNQNFVLTAGGGTGAFTAAGQMRYFQVDTDGLGGVDSTLVEGNVAGASGAEIAVLLHGYTGALAAGDFVL